MDEANFGFNDPETMRVNAISSTVDELKTLLLAKNKDYGSSAFQEPFFSKCNREEAFFIRIGDKINRLKALVSGEQPAVNESINDTLIDLAGYCILLTVLRKEQSFKEF